MRKSIAVIAVLLFAAVAAAQPTYHSGTPNNQVVSVGTKFNCATTLYDPEVYLLSTGKLVMWGQGGSTQSCSKGIDSLYTATYNPPVNNWKVPLATDCPTLTGKTMCDHIPNINPDPTGPLASPSAVKLNGKVYMAYVAGNADYERGRVNWAVGTDMNLSVYPNAANPISIITPTPTSKTFCQQHGIGQLRLAYENGFFYFILFYHHFRDGSGPLSTLAYRINYDATNAWGLGTTRQIFKDGTWVAHDGNLIFNYDSPTGLPVYGNYETRGLQFAGQGDLKWDPARQRWIHVYSTFGNNTIYWQESPSLDWGTWSAQVEVDVSKIRAKYPSTPFVGAAVWYGDITSDGVNNPRWYLFAPIHGGAACGGVFAGLSVAMSTLDYF